jgi:hypothetical protein
MKINLSAKFFVRSRRIVGFGSQVPGRGASSADSFSGQQRGNAMAPYNFDDRGIKWTTLTLPPVGELKHLVFSMLNVDEENHIAHVLFKFAANEKIVLHRHMIHNNTFVVQGEHRL